MYLSVISYINYPSLYKREEKKRPDQAGKIHWIND